MHNVCERKGGGKGMEEFNGAMAVPNVGSAKMGAFHD